MIAICDATSRQVRRGGTGRAIFDATIARLCMSSNLLEAGGVLSSGRNSTMTMKKKMVTTKLAEVQARPPKVGETPSIPVSSQVKDLQWDSLQELLAGTPGLKRVASHLQLKSIGTNQLSLTVADSGRDALQYIVSQRKTIEETISKYASRLITVEISACAPNPKQMTKSIPEDSIEGNELVQAARGLFDGTVVQVKNLGKEEQ
jgi:hypothetical protein